MSIHFSPLLDEAGKPEFKPWETVLHHLALLHESSLYSIGTSPAPYPLETIGPGYCFGPAFGHWDLIFALLDSCPAMPEHTLQQLENMLVFQQPDGFLPGAIFFKGDNPDPSWFSTFPAVWPLAADEYFRVTGSKAAAELCLEPLIRQIRWLENNRRADGFGYYYLDVSTDAVTRWESGVDESVRCETVRELGKFPCIDATSHMRLLYDAAARWSEMLGRPGVEEFTGKRQELDKIIQTKFFSEETGFFHDAYLLERGIKYRSLNGVWALTCGAASPEQAQRVIDKSLLSPERFFTEHPLPFIAANEPQFELRMWRGPSWNSLTWMAILGCLRYGRKDAAVRIAEKALHWSQIQYNRTGALWEFYHPHGKSPLSVARKRPPCTIPCREYLGHNPLFAMARLCAG